MPECLAYVVLIRMGENMQPFMGYIMDRIRSMRKEVQKCCKLYIGKRMEEFTYQDENGEKFLRLMGFLLFGSFVAAMPQPVQELFTENRIHQIMIIAFPAVEKSSVFGDVFRLLAFLELCAPFAIACMRWLPAPVIPMKGRLEPVEFPLGIFVFTLMLSVIMSVLSFYFPGK